MAAGDRLPAAPGLAARPAPAAGIALALGLILPSHVKGYRNQDGVSLGNRLMFTWFDR